jgi:hypothetical protein
MMFDDRISFLNDIKKDAFILTNIIWDIEPKQLMEPRIKKIDTGIEFRKPISGYFFYIDIINKKPALFLMRHTSADYAETIARIDEIPDELLIESVDENKDKQYFGMYPINNKVENWLKKELGIKE